MSGYDCASGSWNVSSAFDSHVRDKDGNLVAVSQGNECEANADLIVRSVNAHDELVSALAQAVDCRKCHECPDEDWLERAQVGVGEGEGIVTALVAKTALPHVNIVPETLHGQ